MIFSWLTENGTLMNKITQIPFYMVYNCKLIKFDTDREEVSETVFFHSTNKRLLHMDEIDEQYDDGINFLINKRVNLTCSIVPPIKA